MAGRFLNKLAFLTVTSSASPSETPGAGLDLPGGWSQCLVTLRAVRIPLANYAHMKPVKRHGGRAQCEPRASRVGCLPPQWIGEATTFSWYRRRISVSLRGQKAERFLVRTIRDNKLFLIMQSHAQSPVASRLL